MSILDWIEVGEVSAERDELLSNYFYDNGALRRVIDNKTSFLVLGRKGAGKTAVFRYLENNYAQYIGPNNILVSLSFEDYNWGVHSLLKRPESAESQTYKQSWRFIILVEAIKAYIKHLETNFKPIPPSMRKAKKLLTKLFDDPIPSIYTIVSSKLFSLSEISLPSCGLDLEDGDISSINLGGGKISFDQISKDSGLQETLSRNMENIIRILEEAIQDASPLMSNIFVVFDKVDEAWDEISYEKSSHVIAGLVGAADSITSHYNGVIRPIVFLREDIFETLSINDANKLREDCGALLHWDKDSLFRLVLKRINYFASQKGLPDIEDIDSLFDKKEMRQRSRPSNYLLKRSMMRPRDLICFLRRIIDTMKSEQSDPFSNEKNDFPLLSSEAVYEAESGYSSWLKQELFDEWGAQRPIIRDLFRALENHGSTNITNFHLSSEVSKLGKPCERSDAIEHLRFLFDNSVIGYKSGQQNYWKHKCFYPSIGFVDADDYRIHDGLVRALSLKEPRERDA
ncbi:putative ATPase [Desulfovibrio sp. A2]|nr:putative ATPase [Desulfovibrio sp. A2]